MRVILFFIVIAMFFYHYSFTFAPYYGEKYMHVEKELLDDMNNSAQEFMRYGILYYGFLFVMIWLCIRNPDKIIVAIRQIMDD
jgi:hypothetical protein